MKILVVSHYFPPEVNAPARRTYDHCREWVRAGHEVHVITGVPSHPSGRVFPGYRRAWYTVENKDGIHVHRVWTLLAANRRIVRRTLNYLSFVPTSVWRAWRLGDVDVLVGTSPQFFCAVAAWVAARLTRTPWVFELRDLWPASIAAVGVTRVMVPLALLERLELRLYRDAAMVICLTNAFIDNLKSRGVPASKLRFVPNGVDVRVWSSGRREVGRARVGAAPVEIVVVYIGTIGLAHGVATTLQAAARLLGTRPDIRFILVGDGAELERLRDEAARRGLTNVSFEGQRPHEEIPDYLAAADIALVTLRRSDVFKTVLPSKMFEAMGAARPIVLGAEGEAQATLERAGAGVAVAPEDPDALAAAIEALGADESLRTRLGASGRSFVEHEFSRGTWARRMVGYLEEAARPAPTRLGAQSPPVL